MTLKLDEIIHLVGIDAVLTVDVTPDGHGDCIRSVVEQPTDGQHATQKQQRMFVKPHEERMEIGKFRNLLRTDVIDAADDDDGSRVLDSNGLAHCHLHSQCDQVEKTNAADCTYEGAVVYYSRQNDCLRTEMSYLFDTQLFPSTFTFAEQAFGTGPPDAINLWIGNERSVSSMHKDHYENLFYVCSGQKEFILCPPSDVIFLHENEFTSGTFHPIPNNKSGETSWGVVADERSDTNAESTKTRWIEPDMKRCLENASSSTEEFPLISKAHPVKVLVSEGEMLYIPSLWYHRVTQTCETIGINYWYDMKFDSAHWCYFNFLQNLKKQDMNLDENKDT